jgi:hypothetical protein
MANLKLSKSNETRFEALKTKFASKKLRKKDWDAIMNQLLEGLSDAHIERMVDQHIPDDAVIREALANPEAKKAIAEYLRKQSKKAKTDAPGSENQQTAKAS